MGDEVLDCMSDGSCGDETPGKPLFGLKVCPGTMFLAEETQISFWVHLHFLLNLVHGSL